MSLFQGLSAFPITPASVEGDVDTDALESLLQPLKAAQVDSIGLLGSTGTYAYLTRKERARTVEAAKAALPDRLPLIVGVGALRTDEVIGLARDAQGAGADGLLLAPVSYTPLNAEEVYQHYLAAARAVDLPICIYNNPGTTGFAFDLPLLARLAEIPTIAAVKMPLPASGGIATDLGAMRAVLPADFQIGYSGDWGCGHALLAGADCWYSVIAGTLPDVAAALAKAGFNKDSDEVAALEESLAPMWQAFQTYGSLRVVYAILQIKGMICHDPPRPILPVPKEALTEIEAALDVLTA